MCVCKQCFTMLNCISLARTSCPIVRTLRSFHCIEWVTRCWLAHKNKLVQHALRTSSSFLWKIMMVMNLPRTSHISISTQSTRSCYHWRHDRYGARGSCSIQRPFYNSWGHPGCVRMRSCQTMRGCQAGSGKWDIHRKWHWSSEVLYLLLFL